MRKSAKDKEIERLVTKIVAAGGEKLSPTNPYEMARFRTRYGVGIIYTNAKGQQTWNREAVTAEDHISSRSGSLAPVKVVSRAGSAKRRSSVLQIFERDGESCFFCGEALGDDVTVEHIVPVAHGGPNHISNLVCAHASCNQEAGHLSGAEKVALALSKRVALIQVGELSI